MMTASRSSDVMLRPGGNVAVFPQEAALFAQKHIVSCRAKHMISAPAKHTFLPSFGPLDRLTDTHRNDAEYQTWVLDRYLYGYDVAGNRLWKQNAGPGEPL